MRAIAAILALPIAGCGGYEVVSADVSSLGFDLALVVTLDGNGEPVRVSEPFGPATGSAPSLFLEEAEREARVIGFRRSALAPIWPGAEALELGLVRITLETPPPAAVLRLEGPDKRVFAPLPVEAEVRELPGLAPRPPELLSRLRLDLPVPEDLPIMPLVPFAERARLLEGVSRIRGAEAMPGLGFERVVPIDRDRVLVVNDRFLAVVSRGGTLDPVAAYDPAGGNQLLTVDELQGASDPSARLQDAALLPADVTGRRKIVASGRFARMGAIWELELEASGLRALGPVEIEADPRAPVLPEVRIIRADHRGAIIAGAGEGVLLIRGPGAERFSLQLALREQHASTMIKVSGVMSGISALRATGLASAPHLIGVESGAVYLGNVEEGRFELQVHSRVLLSQAQDPHVLDVWLEVGPGLRRELWAATRYGGLLRALNGTDWAVVRPLIPAAFERCASLSPQGGFEISANFMGFAFTEDHVHLAVQGCNGALRLRRRDDCAAAIPIGTEAIEATARELTSITAFEGRILMSGEQGAILELEPR